MSQGHNQMKEAEEKKAQLITMAFGGALTATSMKKLGCVVGR